MKKKLRTLFVFVLLLSSIPILQGKHKVMQNHDYANKCNDLPLEYVNILQGASQTKKICIINTRISGYFFDNNKDTQPKFIPPCGNLTQNIRYNLYKVILPVILPKVNLNDDRMKQYPG